MCGVRLVSAADTVIRVRRRRYFYDADAEAGVVVPRTHTEVCQDLDRLRWLDTLTV